MPDWLGNNGTGKIVWATVFSFAFTLPISIPRKLTSLRFTSFVSFAISVFIIFTIFSLCFKQSQATGDHDFHERTKYAWDNATVTVASIFNSIPLILFSYMY